LADVLPALPDLGRFAHFRSSLAGVFRALVAIFLLGRHRSNLFGRIKKSSVAILPLSRVAIVINGSFSISAKGVVAWGGAYSVGINERIDRKYPPKRCGSKKD